jgi:subtilase family serine protease
MTRTLGPFGASRLLAAAAVVAATAGALLVTGAGAGPRPLTFHPLVSEAQWVAAGETPPAQADCVAISRRCFTPMAEQNSYNLTPLLAQGHQGQGETIAVVDAFGSDTMPHDLRVFDTASGLPHMCGEEGMESGCPAGMPTFSVLQQGNVNTNPQPPNQGTGQEDHALWALEVALDVEWAHAMAPMANILLVTTPTAETLGVQGFPDFMKAERQVVEQHLASVISQSFGSAEEAFHSPQSLLNLRDAFQVAQANHVTVLASSGDDGSAGFMKEPVENPALIPTPAVQWPAADLLVTSVGGTYECTDATTGTTVDSVSPPVNCRSFPGQREIGWIDSGGGFSRLFPAPAFQAGLPAGSTAGTGMRGVPDVALQASARTGVLIYSTNPVIRTNVGDLGWLVIGGTSAGSPQWAGIVAVANEVNGHRPLGFLSPALYAVARDPARYAADFFDVTTGNNQAFASVPGFPAGPGWDPVTGLGTPNVARLIPDLIAASAT